MKETEQIHEVEEVEILEEISELEENLEYEELESAEEPEEFEEIEEAEENEYFVESNENYTRTKSLRKLITLVGVTAIMLVSSTYAWFTAQKNVTIGNLEGKVNVAEGLMISLDAKNWSQEVNFDSPILDAGQTLDVPYAASADGTSYTAGQNNRPEELIPVSATGIEDIDTNEEITFYTGTNINISELYGIQKTKAHVSESTNGAADSQYAGFYAIDLFLQNSSKIGEGETQGEATETLQLNTNSLLSVLSSGGSSLTGLQNTARVALAMYSTDGLNNDADTVETDTSSIFVTASQSQVLTAYEGQKISDIAIWEPNASTHVDYIVTNNNTLKLTTAVDGLYTASTADANNNNISKFTATEVVPTYAMTAESLNASQQLQDYNATSNADKVGIADIYNWNITDTDSDKVDDNTGLSRQIALQTDTESDYTIAEGGVRNLVSVTSPGAYIYEMGNEDDVVTFEMLKNSIIKLRMYVWLEGQDVDCTNFASHGGGIEVDLGLVKSAEVGSSTGGSTESAATPYMPTGFSLVSEATSTTGYTIKDGSNNQYVWVEVPQDTTVYSTETLALDLDSLSGDDLTNAYTAIEEDLHTYTATYRNDTTYTDTWYSEEQHGFASSDDYNALKYKMLKSVFENGGFYVGKYETGIADTEPDVIDETVEARTAKTDAIEDYTPVIQANAYPYNFVTCSQAQSLASGMASGEYTSSLMFGVQWDLVLKYLETKAVEQGTSQDTIISELNSNSTSWGNCRNSTYNITNTSAKNYVSAWVDGAYGEKTYNTNVLLSTGADDSFSKQGIYDLAGNVSEWTLEYASSTSYPCALRGGGYNNYGSLCPASQRYNTTIAADRSYGFRVALY